MNNSNINQDLLETIERYNNHSMANEERKNFEIKLQNDPEFKSQVEELKTLILGIETQSLKEQLEEFHTKIYEKPIKNNSLKNRILPILKYGVAAVILIAIGNYWFFGKPSNEKLYMQYFVPDAGLPTTMSKTENFEFFDAMVNYKYGDYGVAITKWEKIQQKKPDNDTINYFLGVANLASGNAKKAIPFLKKTAHNTESKFNNDANFYLALAYLKTNNKQYAIRYLQINNSVKSKELIDKLKK